MPDEIRSNAREIHIQLPRDHLKSLLDGKQHSVPFVTSELGFPVRIVIWGVDAPAKAPRYGSSKKKREPGDEDDEQRGDSR